MSGKAKTKIICCVITGGFSLISLVVSHVLTKEQVFRDLQQQVVSINGDNNVVTFNSVDDFVQSFLKVNDENVILREKNDSYFEDIINLKAELKEKNAILKENSEALNAVPAMTFSDVGLSVNGEDINVKKLNSMLAINNTEYFSRDFLKGFLRDDQQMTLKDGILYIGRVIAEKASLFDQYVNDGKNISIVESARDSFGEMHSKSLEIFTHSRKSHIIFSLQNRYSMMKFKLVASENAKLNRKGNIIIYADQELVYTSPDISKTMEEISKEIPINHCSLLTITYVGDTSMDCIMSDIEVYNEE